ncbi:MAG: winged helix-turn-helix transcriptional regulator [Chloroflexi bacterium]|nr:winged helix-turn-helix transcriptional regulator [Chloroflexota bacterium]
MVSTDAKAKVLAAFHKAAPADISVSEAADRAHVSPNTASTYIKVLVAEGVLEESRKIGNAKLFRLKGGQ